VAQLRDALKRLDLHPGYDVERELAAAKQIEREAELLEDAALFNSARLTHAGSLARIGEIGAAARIIWEVNRWATASGNSAILARSHRQLSTVYCALGEPGTALEHSVLAVELLDDDTPPRTRAIHLIALADALSDTGSPEAARERYNSAEQILIGCDDTRLRLDALNNLAYSECQAGEPERAWAAVERLRAVTAAAGMDIDASYLDTIARAQILLGRYAEAEQTILGDIDVEGPNRYTQADSLAHNLLTLAEAQRRQGRIECAQQALDRCRTICEERGLAEIRLRADHEQAELYAAAGKFEEAYEAYKNYHVRAQDLYSHQREAQARSRHAMFETIEARREAQRFREQALRDPLTGLHNRRYADEQLPVLIAEANQTGAPLTIALVDLDHFKRVNDSLSHDVGDKVLVRLGKLLTRSVEEIAATEGRDRGFVARMGGEEFLLALPNTNRAVAGSRLEQVRLAVRSYPWQPITGGLPITISIGAATTGRRSTQTALLACADRNLYTAKHAGRDLVVIDQDTGPARDTRRRNRDANGN
jgi:diguanylate cyclase (GGDEF)-like protein